MSGPKVVCIVTREEVEALCRNLLALVNDAVAHLRATAERHGHADDSVVAGLAGRRARLERLLAEDRFLDLQKQAPREVTFLRKEAARIHAEAVARREAQRTRGRRLQDAARSAASAFRVAGRIPPRNLEAVATRAAAAGEGELAAMQEIVDRSLRELGRDAAAAPPSAEGAALARRLVAGEAGQTLAVWLTAHPAEGEVPAAEARLQRLLAEIETLDEPTTAAPYLARAAAIADEASEHRRALLTDSLVLDLAERKRQREARAAVLVGLREARAALGALDTAAAWAMAKRLDTAIDENDGTSELAREALDLVAAEMRTRAATARRKAVLEGLAALGYEVREGMATAWAENGRVVVKKPGTSDYGVELGSPQDASRLQVRVVRSSAAAPDAGRDRDAETVWCAEFGRLRSLLATSGAEMTVERALAPGAQAVKVASFPEGAAMADTALASTRQRQTLP